MSNSPKNLLTLYEREKIEYWLKLGRGLRCIARYLKRDVSVVSRELERNGYPRRPYVAKQAQARANRLACKTNKRKLDKDEVLHNYVKKMLKKEWSPEVIAGRLKRHDVPKYVRGKYISHEAIYDYIYHGNGKHWYRYLCKGKEKRRKQKGRKPQGNTIPGRISINERPEGINFGHWESDSVVFSRQSSRLSVQYERLSKVVRLHRLANGTAPETTMALEQTMESLPQFCFQSFTFDNGGENAGHLSLKNDYNINTYFCDAYASWQKGGVENANGLVRRYLPRKTRLDEITDEQLYNIQEKINNRPRKSLDYQTPNEVLRTHIEARGVALNP